MSRACIPSAGRTHFPKSWASPHKALDVTALAASSVRHYTAPVSNKYTPLKSPFSLWWYRKVPPIAKYSGGILSAALALTNIHPNVLGTLAPPALLAAYYTGTRIEKLNYQKSLSLMKQGPHATWRIKTYDESSLENVKQGIENEYDHFKTQVHAMLETQMVDFLVQLDQSGSVWTKDVLDENKQIVFQLGSPETFVNSKAEGDESIVQFISLSVPYYSSRIHNKKRLGVVQVSMLEQEKGEGYVDYDVAAQIWPYKFFSKPKRIC